MTDDDAVWKRKIERELGSITATLEDRARSRDAVERDVRALQTILWRFVGGLILANILLPLGVVIWLKFAGGS